MSNFQNILKHHQKTRKTISKNLPNLTSNTPQTPIEEYIDSDEDEDFNIENRKFTKKIITPRIVQRNEQKRKRNENNENFDDLNPKRKRRKISSDVKIYDRYFELAKVLKHKGDDDKTIEKYKFYINSGINFMKAALSKKKTNEMESFELFKSTGLFFSKMISANLMKFPNGAEIIKIMNLGIASCYFNSFKINVSKLIKKGEQISKFFGKNNERNKGQSFNNQKITPQLKQRKYSPIISPDENQKNSPNVNYINQNNSFFLSKEELKNAVNYIEESNHYVITLNSLEKSKSLQSPMHKNLLNCSVEEICDFMEEKTRVCFLSKK